MELKEGYKMSELGMIPKDWEVLTLGKLGGFKNGINKGANDFGFGFPFINLLDVFGKNHLGKNVELGLVNSSLLERKLYNLLEGDVIFIRSSVKPSGVGLTIVIDDELSDTVFSGFLIRYRETGSLDNNFKRFCFHNELFRNQLIANSTVSANTNINQVALKKLLIAVPSSLREQTAIATALSDMDALIAQTEKLIAKKIAIKHGVMQHLLSPHDEHGNLKKGWVVKTLGDIATLKARIGWQGLTTAEYRRTGDYLLITGTEFKNGFIDWDNCFYVEEDRYKQDKNIQIKKQDVLVTKDGTIGKVALIDSVPLPATLNSGVFVIRPIDYSFNPTFFYYLLLSEAFKFFLSQLSAGSTINHLYQKDFVTFKFSAPESIDEQVAIAKILSDQDAEIKLLQNRYQKQKAQKQGMMQNLLTGKIRIYKPQHESAAAI